MNKLNIKTSAAAYYGQELLSTFETSIGELSLIPTTGGIFTVYIECGQDRKDEEGHDQIASHLIWDFKVRMSICMKSLALIQLLTY